MHQPDALQLDRLESPVSSDSRLADGLRQLLPSISPQSTAGIVLFSDGRVRSAEAVESLASYYRELNVPIHVAPVGKSSGAGDVAIVSLVVEPTVRKFTENEVKVFFRSFGYNGERTEVRLMAANPTTGNVDTLSSIPVTLSGGAQSASLPFRIESQPLDLTIKIDALSDELSTMNNEVQTSVEIDRTKIRVLYVEGDPQQSTLNGQTLLVEGTTPLNLPQALSVDEDVECTMLYAPGQGQATVRIGSTASSLTTFPRTRAELFSFDCVIFSNCSIETIDEAAQRNLEQWITGRGGGLILAGTEAIQADQWNTDQALKLTPFIPASMRFESPSAQPMNIAASRHPIWQLSREARANDRILAAIPQLTGALADAKIKPTAIALSSTESGTVWIAAMEYGRGRVLASAAAIAGRAMSDYSQQWGTTGDQVTSRFWRNLVYWTTEGSSVGRRRLVIDTDKQFYRPGDRIQISAVAYDEGALKTQAYRIYAMLEPSSLDDMSLYSPVLWPENVTRESGEVGPRIAWGEELLLPTQAATENCMIEMDISESGITSDTGIRLELTAYEGEESSAAFGHGTQVDSSSLAIQILSDPFEQQNPLPNHELLEQVARLSGGKVLSTPHELQNLIEFRETIQSEPKIDSWPAWSRWWVWAILVGLLTTEWVWRKLQGYA